MHIHSLFCLFVVLIATWTVYAGSWHQGAVGFRRSLGFHNNADMRRNIMARHGGEADGVITASRVNVQPTGTGIPPPSGTGSATPILGVARQQNSTNSSITQGCPAPLSVTGGVVPSGNGTAVSVGTGLPVRAAQGTAVSSGFPLPVGTGVAHKISFTGTAAPTAGARRGKVRYGLPYHI